MCSTAFQRCDSKLFEIPAFFAERVLYVHMKLNPKWNPRALPAACVFRGYIMYVSQHTHSEYISVMWSIFQYVTRLRAAQAATAAAAATETSTEATTAKRMTKCANDTTRHDQQKQCDDTKTQREWAAKEHRKSDDNKMCVCVCISNSKSCVYLLANEANVSYYKHKCTRVRLR